MRHSSKIVIALLVLLTARAGAAELPTAKPESVGMSSKKLAKVTELMNKQVADAKIAGGVVAIARRGKVVYFEAYGKRDLAEGKPMETDTIVRLYSMTKSIATTAAMMLVEEGKLEIDAPASKYVPALADVKVWTEDGLVAPKRPITVADLMRHTAGFGRPGLDEVGKALLKARLRRAASLEDYVDRLASAPLAYHPGEQWIYSNSIDVLGLVVQKVSGKPFGEFLSERLFEPLGMVDTGFYVPAAKLDRFAVNYSRGIKRLNPIKTHGANEKYHSMPPVQSGGGGLVGTAGDYMRFLLMIAGGGEREGKRYLKPESLKLMTTDQLPKQAFPIGFGKKKRHGVGFSFGFSIRTAKPGQIGEYGWGGAASTHYWVSPKDEGLIVVTLEQIMPYNSDTETLLKPVIYDAIKQ